MDIKRQSSKFYREYDDGKDYYLKNKHGNILEVSKVIMMERFGYRFENAKDTPTEDRIGMWRKRLPAEEGFEVVTKKEWQDLENERLKITPPPVTKPKMGPDEGQIIRAKEEAEARAKAESEAAAAAEAEAAKLAEEEARAKAEAEKGNE